MKSSCNHFFKLFHLWGGVFVCIVLFASCENFLKSNQVKNEIIDAISYNNAVSCTVALKADSATGEFLEGNQITIKVGYDVKVQFFVNQEDYYFKDLSAVCNTNYAESRSDFVELKCIEKDEKKGIYTYSIKLLKEAKDIAIRPVCYAYPQITSYSPVSTKKDNQANTPIKLDFNVPFQDSSVFNYENIIIEAFNEPADSLFETPVLSEDGLTLSIYPKANDIISKINNKNAAVMSVKISFTDKIQTLQNEIPLPLKQNSNSSFTVYYIPQKEESAPEQKAFFITSNEITLQTVSSITDSQKFHDTDITDNYGLTTEQYRQKVLQNLVKNTVYIYGCFYDGDSGVKTVAVKEQTTNHQITGAAVVVDPTITYYTANSDGVEFVTEGGETKFCIKHTLTQDNGLVALDISVLDACENPCNVKRHYAVKKDGFENIGFFYVSNDRDIISGEIDVNEYHEKIKKFSVFDYFYGAQYNYYYPPIVYKRVIFSQNQMNIKCEYTDKNGILKTEPLVVDSSYATGYKWYIDLAQEIDTVAGFSFAIIIQDPLGNEKRKTFTVPDENNCEVIIDPKESFTYSDTDDKIWSDNDDNYRYDILDKNSHLGIYHLRVKKDSDGKKYIEGTPYNSFPALYGTQHFSKNEPIQPGYDYFFIPVELGEDFPPQNYDPHLLGEISNYSINSDNYTTSLVTSPQIEKLEIQKTDEPGNIDIIVKLKAGTWENFDDLYVSSETTGMSFVFDKTKGMFTYRGDVYLIKKIPGFDRTIKVTGVKGVNTVESEPVSLSLKTAQTIKEYDKVPPVFNRYFSSTSGNMGTTIIRQDNYFTIFSDDNCSEPDPQKGTIKILDEKNNVFKTYDWASIDDESIKFFSIPVWELMPMTGMYRNIKYELYDNAGNAAIDTISSYEALKYKSDIILFKEVTADKKLAILKDTSDLLPGYGYYYDQDNKMWKVIRVYSDREGEFINWYLGATYKTIYDPVLGQKWLFEYNLAPNETFEVDINNSFLKFLGSASNYSVVNIIYFYNGTSGTGDYDWFISNGESTDSMLVSSDAPVLIHTYITQLPYETCKDWSAQEWETYKQTCGEKYICFSSTDHAQRRYSIPVKEIPQGSCYCAVAHFSDNHTEKSRVFVK